MINSKKILSPLDYRRLLLTRVNLWSDEELSQFLVFDFINTLCNSHVLGNVSPEGAIEANKAFVEKYEKYINIFNFIDKLFWWATSLFNTGRNKEKILFQHLKLNFIRESKKTYSVGLIVQGKRDRIFAIKNFINYISTTDLYKYVYNYLKEGDVKNLHALVKKAKDKLEIIKPNYIVFGLDVLPIERAIILAAKELSIPTLAIQDGYLSPDNMLLNCVAVDYILAWGEHFRNLWVEKFEKKPEDVYVLGYPYPIPKYFKNSKQVNYVLCYLGQDYERFDIKFFPIKIKIIKELSEICRRLGIKFIYRPHPGDNRALISEKLPDICFTPKGEILEETFKTADIFISFSSTALIEATMRGKIALQLENYPIKLDNFEELGICTKTFQRTVELEKYLAEIIKSKNLGKFKIEFNNNYIETRHNSGQRFLEIIDNIRKRRRANN